MNMIIRDGLHMDIEGFLKRATGITTEDLLKCKTAYDSPGRHYHHFRHAIFVAAEAIMAHCCEPFEKPREVLVAALYHDAIYRPGTPDNELNSALLMRDHLASYEYLDLDYAAHLIVLTAKHFKHEPGSLSADDAKFLDCDLVSLAYPWDDFLRQNDQLDQEGIDAGLPADMVKEFRGPFLKSILERDHIFSSPRCVMEYEAKARENIERLIAERYS